LFIIKLLYFASAATDLQTEKYLGCSRKIVAFATAYLFISIKTFYHSVPTIVGKSRDPFRSISIKTISLIFSTFVANTRSISLHLYQEILSRSAQLWRS